MNKSSETYVEIDDFARYHNSKELFRRGGQGFTKSLSDLGGYLPSAFHGCILEFVLGGSVRHVELERERDLRANAIRVSL
jgi:hypothetical protein